MHPYRRQIIALGHKIEEGSIESLHGSSSPTIYVRNGTIVLNGRRGEQRLAPKFLSHFKFSLRNPGSLAPRGSFVLASGTTELTNHG